MGKYSKVLLSLVVASTIFIGCGSGNKNNNTDNNQQVIDNGSNSGNTDSGKTDGGSTNSENGSSNVNNENNNSNNSNSGNADGNTSSAGKSITINNVKDIYGYEIQSKFVNKQLNVSSEMTETYDCGGKVHIVQTVTGSDFSKTEKNEGKNFTIKDGIGSSAGKKIFGYEMKDGSAGNYYILEPNNQIIAGVTKIVGLKNSEILSIVKKQDCN